MLIVYTLYAFLVLTTLHVLKDGDRAERIGVLWQLLNAAIQLVNELSGLKSTTVHLIADGVFAIGLLPAAVYYVSWWIGVQTLLSAVGFGLQAFYLLFDRPADHAFSNFSNVIFALMLLNLNIAAAASAWSRRRQSGDGRLAPALAGL